MSEQQIYVSRTIAAHQWAVWELIADVTTWIEWGPFDVAELEIPGAFDLQGEGAVRLFRTGKRTTWELVTACTAPRALTYRLLSGIPVRSYEAIVSLQTSSQGTVVAWSSRFRPAIPGTGGAIRKRLEQFIMQLLEGLAAKLEGGDEFATSASAGAEWPVVVGDHPAPSAHDADETREPSRPVTARRRHVD